MKKKGILIWATLILLCLALSGCDSIAPEHENHTISYIAAVKSTCKDEGNVEYWHCEECDKNFSDKYCKTEIFSVTTPVASHDIKYVLAQSVTCTKEGYPAHYQCNVCNKWFSDRSGATEIDPVILRPSHKWSVATCTKPLKCSVCGIEEGEPIDHLGIGKCKFCGKLSDGWYDEGQYRVGKDIVAGEYFLYTTSSMYFAVTTDTTGSLSSIIANGNESNFTYVTVEDGQYLEIKRGVFTLADFDKNPCTEQFKSEPLSAGMYRVGKDISAGEYVAVCKSGSGYVEVTSDSKHVLSSVICNENISTHIYITVKDGEYLTLNKCVLYTLEKAPSFTPIDGIYGNGMYKVGRDIEAGEYKINSISDKTAYVGVYSDSLGVLSSILMNDNFTGEKYITISDGQYIEIKNGQIIVD